MTEPAGTGERRLRLTTIVASLVGMWAVAVAQPLLDLIGRNAAFLVAHDATRGDVVAMVVAVTIVAPLLLAGAVVGLRVVDDDWAVWLHVTFVALLAAVIVLVVLQFSGITARVPGLLALLVAAIVGAGFALAYRTSSRLRTAVAFTAIAAPGVAVLFVFMSPASAVVFPQPSDAEPVTVPDDAPPIVMVMFDELPLASLVDRDGEIMPATFPNFARLARDATFLRNVTTVHGQTSDAVPAVLSSQYPVAAKLPLAADHPNNLFTLLGSDYALHVEEPLTELCPVGRCGAPSTPALARRTDLLVDLGVVAAHLIVPPDVVGGLPPVDQGWRDFRAAADEAGKEGAVRDRFRNARRASPAATFEHFVRQIRDQSQPVVHYIHTLLPHSPWRYLADGTAYAEQRPAAGLVRGRWTSDPWPVAQGYQRHLVQTQLADRLLGILLDRLEAEGLYDDALIVVMSDHGVSFTPGTSLRVISEATIPEIARVPVLLKAPEQSHSETIDRPLEAVDILPTMLDAIGASVPDGLAGRSAFDGSVAVRTVRRFFGPDRVLAITDRDADISDVVDRNLSWFASHGHAALPYRLAPPGLASFVGHEVPAGTTTPAESDWELGGDHCAAGESRLRTLPQILCGTVHVDDAGAHALPNVVTPHNIAIAVGDEIVAVTRTYDAMSAAFRAMLPPHVHGRNVEDVRLFVIDRGRTLVELERSAA